MCYRNVATRKNQASFKNGFSNFLVTYIIFNIENKYLTEILKIPKQVMLKITNVIRNKFKKIAGRFKTRYC